MISTKIEKLLRPHKEKERIPIYERYFNSNLSYFGIPVTKLRVLRKSLDISEVDLRDIDTAFRNTRYFEVRSLLLIYLQEKKEELTLKDWVVIKGWSGIVDNWEHADRLADLYATILEKYPEKIYAVLKKWNQDHYSWRRRLSIVSLYYYSAKRKKPVEFEKALQLIGQLISDKDLYVQKGVGWTLREMYNLYPDKTFAYLKSIAAELPAAAWQAATEKLSAKDKESLKRLRLKN